jgi:hypothetical protein
MVVETMKRREEEIEARAPVGKLEGIKPVKVAEAATKEAQKKAYEAANAVADYLEKCGAKKIMPQNSELRQILFE